MRIAFPNENGQINQHFGRSREFAVLEVENRRIVSEKVVSAETFRHDHQGLADLLAGEKAEVVVVGGIGPYALEALEQKGLKVIAGISGDIRAAAEKCARGELVSTGAVCGHHHHSHGHGHHSQGDGHHCHCGDRHGHGHHGHGHSCK